MFAARTVAVFAIAVIDGNGLQQESYAKYLAALTLRLVHCQTLPWCASGPIL